MESGEILKNKVKLKNKGDNIRTYNGEFALISNCYLLRDGYYLKTDYKIVVDFISNENIDKTKARSIIYSELDEEGYPCKNSIKYSLLNVPNLITVYFKKNVEPVKFQDHNILNEYVECLETGNFYHPSIKDYAKRTKTGRYRKVNSIKGFIPYDKLYNQKYGLDSPTFSISEGKRYTMGFELETCKGLLPSYLDEKLNYEAVHDGSLREADGSPPHGGEYVTGVLKGDMGFRQLKLLCNELFKRCKIDKRCGVHLHLGTIDFNKEFIVYMYYLSKKLENELFSLLPHSRRNNEYCRKLDNIDINLNQKFKTSSDYQDYIEDIYNKIVLYVSHQDKLDPTILNKKNNHPLGDKCGYNHNTARYAWLNFVPALFNTRGNEIYTIEFRPMQGSLNYIKIRNMTLIYMSLVYIVENYKSYLIDNPNVTLIDIIKIAYPKRKDELINFITSRKLKFLNKSVSQFEEEMEYEEELKDDNINMKNL